MKRIIKLVGKLLAVVFIAIVIAVVAIYLLSNHKMSKSYNVEAHPVNIVDADSALIAYGERLSRIRGCTDCHGDNLAGKLMIDNPAIARLYAKNLTPGKGGIDNYTIEDWERSIRHGIGKDNKPLLFMPATEFFALSDEDLGALIAYLNSLEPVDNILPENSIGMLGRFLYLIGKIPLIQAEIIDHRSEHPAAPPRSVTAEYGEYLALGCAGCHGKEFSGGPIPGAPPEWPPAANLTPSGNLKNWTEKSFIQTMRTGIKPDGKPFSEFMPYQTASAMTDDELKAVWAFLKSLPAK